MNRSDLSFSSISQEALLFPFFKIIIVYLQNIARSVFLFCLRIGIIYHGENFLIRRTSNNWQNLEMR